MRLTIAGLLLIVGLAGAAFARALILSSADQQSGTADNGAGNAARFDQMIATVAEIGAAQQAYVALGQPSDPWVQRVSELLQRLQRDLAAIPTERQSPDAALRLQELTETLQDFERIDARVRENLINGQDLTASDLIFTDAHNALTSLATSLGQLREAERAAAAASRTTLAQLGWALLGAVALFWMVGLVLAIRRPAPVRPEVAETQVATEEAAAGSREPQSPIEFASAEATVDLQAAADVCTAISRVTSTDALPDLLARAAVVLDAPGIIVWMGAGEELFAVTAHGYEARVLARLGPIGRHANNATAAAWRSGELSTVPGDAVSNGAIVTPMFGIEGCIGVLAAELRHGREADPAARAVTTMFAAQLAAVISAWPAASSTPSRTEAVS